MLKSFITIVPSYIRKYHKFVGIVTHAAHFNNTDKQQSHGNTYTLLLSILAGSGMTSWRKLSRHCNNFLRNNVMHTLLTSNNM